MSACGQDIIVNGPAVDGAPEAAPKGLVELECVSMCACDE